MHACLYKINNDNELTNSVRAYTKETRQQKLKDLEIRDRRNKQPKHSFIIIITPQIIDRNLRVAQCYCLLNRLPRKFPERIGFESNRECIRFLVAAK